ncbi:MAG: 2-octaprenyl-3-methyl-6-methoxy-1,4-benzoquinol hydroxylase [Gammaproteobacteria bacterium]|nr:FAD-dependent monooxygenase [Gammaproteobacteria bacterium]NND53403.1 2-octaprenyl-3-methyl-6-methoxy-1,4-benzoquinol hydroxylase [Gammaproteobacteria bacterium]
MSQPRSYDVVIAGGGVIGLLLARLLTELRCGADALRIAVIEPDPPMPVSDESLDLRVSALSPASLQMLDSVGCLARVPAHAQCAFDTMRVWQNGDGPENDHAICFSAAQAGAAELGRIVENRSVRAVLWSLLEEDGRCDLLQAELTALTERAGDMQLQLTNGVAHTRLLIGADGAASPVRELLGIRSREITYGENALVAHLQPALPHQATAWQKFLPGGPAALLPLADGRVSLVWSHPEDDTEHLLALDDQEFAARLTRELDGVLGELSCTTARAVFPLCSAHAERYTGRRFALVGDAAHRIHPLAGQGANLGMRDVAALSSELREFLRQPLADPGDPRMLRRYERSRKGDNALTLRTMQGLDGLFTSGLAELAGAGMGMVDRSPLLKSMLARYAMGG